MKVKARVAVGVTRRDVPSRAAVQGPAPPRPGWCGTPVPWGHRLPPRQPPEPGLASTPSTSSLQTQHLPEGPSTGQEHQEHHPCTGTVSLTRQHQPPGTRPSCGSSPILPRGHGDSQRATAARAGTPGAQPPTWAPTRTPETEQSAGSCRHSTRLSPARRDRGTRGSRQLPPGSRVRTRWSLDPPLHPGAGDTAQGHLLTIGNHVTAHSRAHGTGRAPKPTRWCRGGS